MRNGRGLDTDTDVAADNGADSSGHWPNRCPDIARLLIGRRLDVSRQLLGHCPDTARQMLGNCRDAMSAAARIFHRQFAGMMADFSAASTRLLRGHFGGSLGGHCPDAARKFHRPLRGNRDGQDGGHCAGYCAAIFCHTRSCCMPRRFQIRHWKRMPMHRPKSS